MKEKYREQHRKHGKEVYEYRKSQGICTRCGREKALPNRVCCLVCSLKQTERNSQYYHRKKAENGN